MARVNSSNAKHRATIARQQAARRKKATGGKLKTHFVTKSGKRVANPKRTHRDKAGRPIFSAATIVSVVDHGGNEMQITARLAAQMMGRDQLPFQELRAA